MGLQGHTFQAKGAARRQDQPELPEDVLPIVCIVPCLLFDNAIHEQDTAQAKSESQC